MSVALCASMDKDEKAEQSQPLLGDRTASTSAAHLASPDDSASRRRLTQFGNKTAAAFQGFVSSIAGEGSDEEGDDGEGDLDAFVASIWANFKLKSFSKIVLDAENLPLTPMKKIVVFSYFFSAAFMSYSIANNWRTRPYTASVQNHTLVLSVVCWLEFILMLLLLLAFLLSCVRAFCTKDTRGAGAHARAVASNIRTLSRLSLMFYMSRLKTFIDDAVKLWHTYGGHGDYTWCTIIKYALAVVLKLLVVLSSILALLMKLSQVAFVREAKMGEYTWDQYIAFFNFLGAVISLYEPDDIAYEAVYTFLFAGRDCKWTKYELHKMHEFQDCIFYRFTKKGMLRGICLVLTFSRSDLQYVLLDDTEEVGDVGNIRDDADIEDIERRSRGSSRDTNDGSGTPAPKFQIDITPSS